MEYETIILEEQDNIARIILYRQEALNAINEKMLEEIVSACEEIEKNDNIRCVILTGSGKFFCAGRDLHEVMEGKAYVGESRYQSLENLTKPVIAAVNGPCYTGAVELIMCADIIIASDNTIFDDNHARFGVIPGGGQTQRLVRQIGAKKAKEMMFTCESITAEEAERIGMVNKVVPLEQLQVAAMEMAQTIIGNNATSISEIKRLINLGLTKGIEAGLAAEEEAHKNKLIMPSEKGMEIIKEILSK